MEDNNNVNTGKTINREMELALKSIKKLGIIMIITGLIGTIIYIVFGIILLGDFVNGADLLRNDISIGQCLVAIVIYVLYCIYGIYFKALYCNPATIKTVCALLLIQNGITAFVAFDFFDFAIAAIFFVSTIHVLCNIKYYEKYYCNKHSANI